MTPQSQGLGLFRNSVNSYHELTVNERMRRAAGHKQTKTLLQFLRSARLGKFKKKLSAVVNQAVVAEFNMERQVVAALEQAGPRAICVAPTNEIVDEVNEVLTKVTKH